MCENTTQPHPDDWTKAPGSLPSPYLHKQPFVFRESWEVKKSDFEDWIFLRGLEWIRLRVRLHSFAVEFFHKGVPLINLCTLCRLCQSIYAVKWTELGKWKRLDGWLWWNKQQRQGGSDKTSGPVCHLAQSLRSYCAFYILIKNAGVECLLGIAIKGAENEKAMKDGSEQRRNGPLNRSLLILACFPAQSRSVSLRCWLESQMAVCDSDSKQKHLHVVTCLSLPVRCWHTQRVHTDILCNIRAVLIYYVLCKKAVRAWLHATTRDCIFWYVKFVIFL